MALGIQGFTYADLFDAERLRDLHVAFDAYLRAQAPQVVAKFDAYRACKGEGMSALEQSEALLMAAPFVGRFVGTLFGVDAELDRLRDAIRQRDPLWRFRKDFAKKRVLRADAGKAWTGGLELARSVARAALQSMTPAPVGGTTDEELTIATAALPLLEIDEVARKAAKAGGAQWTPELRGRARQVRAAIRSIAPAASEGEDDTALGKTTAFALDALEAWLGARRGDEHDPLRRWVTMRVAKTLDFAHLVEELRPDPRVPELFVGPHHERRQRLGFSLTDRRMSAREVEQEIDYCMLCHDREKDSCSHGLPDAKAGGLKKNPSACRSPGARSRRRSARCTRCVRRASSSPPWRSSRWTTRCAPGRGTGSATTA